MPLAPAPGAALAAGGLQADFLPVAPKPHGVPLEPQGCPPHMRPFKRLYGSPINSPLPL